MPSEQAMSSFLLGAIAVADLTAALFFLRFWKNTRDRFFLFFSAAFVVDMVDRALLSFMQVPAENEHILYLMRLVTFGLILIAILDKNRPKK
jgi:hypothetical protein